MITIPIPGGLALTPAEIVGMAEIGDKVNHPKHYNSHPSGVEAITVCEHMNFNVGNAMKYLWRSEHKNGIEDLKKAAWYINREIAKKEKENAGQ